MAAGGSGGHTTTMALDKWPESTLEVAIGVGPLSCRHFLAVRRVRLFLTRIFCGYTYELADGAAADLRAAADDDGSVGGLDGGGSGGGGGGGGGGGEGGAGDDVGGLDDADLALGEDHVGRDAEYFAQRDVWLRRGHMHEISLPLLGAVFVPKIPHRRLWMPWPLRPLERKLRLAGRVLSVPKMKFATHLTFSIAYYFFFLYVVLGTPFPWLGVRSWMSEGRVSPLVGTPFAAHEQSRARSEAARSWRDPQAGDAHWSLEFMLWAWTLLRLVDEIKQMYRRGKSGYEETESRLQLFAYFYSPVNLLDLFNCLAVLSSMFIRLAVSLNADGGFNPHTFALSLRLVQCLCKRSDSTDSMSHMTLRSAASEGADSTAYKPLLAARARVSHVLFSFSLVLNPAVPPARPLCFARAAQTPSVPSSSSSAARTPLRSSRASACCGSSCCG